MNSTTILLRRASVMTPLSSQRFVWKKSLHYHHLSRLQLTSFQAFSTKSNGEDCTTTATDSCNNNNRQQWNTAADCLNDHAQVFTSLPYILGAYVGPSSLRPDLSESIMVAVNSKNNCPYCEGLHGELARMAGVDEYSELQKADSIEKCRELIDDPAVTFARTFANHHRVISKEKESVKDVSSDEVESAFQEVIKVHGEAKANSVRALCWFLAWGSLGGNTLNSVLWEGNREFFPVVFSIYYAPLFGVIAAMNKGLAHMPPMPSVFFQGMGVTLTFAGGAWLAPVGIMGLSRRMIAQSQ